MMAALLTRGSDLGIVEFLIDTGADQTTLSPSDAERLHVYTGNQLVAGCPMVADGIGGRVQLKYLTEVTLRFSGTSRDTDEAVGIRMERLAVQCASRIDRRHGATLSLLGRDVLRFCEFVFATDGVLLGYNGPNIEFDSPACNA
jgi:hypothetical protein